MMIRVLSVLIGCVCYLLLYIIECCAAVCLLFFAPIREQKEREKEKGILMMIGSVFLLLHSSIVHRSTVLRAVLAAS